MLAKLVIRSCSRPYSFHSHTKFSNNRNVTLTPFHRFSFSTSTTASTTASTNTNTSTSTNTNTSILPASTPLTSSGPLLGGVRLRGRSLYLDAQATTALDPRVLDAMLPYMTSLYGNPHSRTHQYGWEAEEAVEKARSSIASLIGCSSKEIIFTSGATESNNLAIKGIAHFYGAQSTPSSSTTKPKRHLITLSTEHKCVLDSMRQLETEGYQVTYLPVKQDGLVDIDVLTAAIRSDTCLVSVMTVNNEIGVIQPIEKIGKICREKGVFFHTDAAQACGKIPLNVDSLHVDLMSISGHKLYGPKGIGCLYVRRRPRVRLSPLISGGGQERGLRSGTLATHLCVGMGSAAAVAQEEMVHDEKHIRELAKRLYRGVQTNIPDVTLNGSLTHRYPGNLNFSFAYVEGESLLMALKEVAVSSGSACTSSSLEPSYVLRALGVPDELAHTSIRFGIGRFTTEEEIDHTIELLKKHVQKLRDMSPLWEMVQDGIDLSKIQWTH